MQKTHYKKELIISATQKKNGANNSKKDVMKIQAWLTLFSLTNPGAGTATGVDGDFGSGTERAVINFQKAKGLPQSGIVTQDTFNVLCQPMKNAFEGTVTGNNLRQLVINAAANHVKSHPDPGFVPIWIITKARFGFGAWALYRLL